MKQDASVVLGAILIVVGILFLAQNTGSIDFPFETGWTYFDTILIIIAGLGILMNNMFTKPNN